MVLPVLERFAGRIVKTMGDAFLVTYESPTNAVLAGMAIQEALQKHNSAHPPEEQMEIRVAINSGEITLHDGDIYGEAVNIASRLEGIAEVGEVYFTEAVFLSMNKTEVPSSEIGFRQFKGIPQKIKVYKVLRETPVGAMPEAAPPEPRPSKEPSARPGSADGASLAPLPAAGRRAGFWPRLFAVLIDAVIIGIITSALVGKPKDGVSVNVTRESKAAEGARVSITTDEGQKIVIRRRKSSKTSRGDPEGGFLSDLTKDLEVIEEKPSGKPTKGPGFVFFWVVYNALFLSFMSTTAGKKILGLKVVDAETGQNLSWKKSVLRSLFTIVSGTPLLLGFGWALWDKQGRTWHDAVIGTRVVPAG